MTDHPLTVEIIEQIAQFEPDLTDQLRLNRTNDMRAAYDKGRDDQLERAVEVFKDIFGSIPYFSPDFAE